MPVLSARNVSKAYGGAPLFERVSLTIVRGERGAFQGIYLGAGPYLSMRSGVGIDDRIIAILDDSLTIAEKEFGVA